MRATGIIRRIDAFGSIIIPKAVREAALGTKDAEGQPMEFYYETDGTIILKPCGYEEETIIEGLMRYTIKE